MSKVIIKRHLRFILTYVISTIRLGTDWVNFCQTANLKTKKTETFTESTKTDTKKNGDFCAEVNNNSTSVNSSLPFAFNSTVNEVRVTQPHDHNPCHPNDSSGSDRTSDPLVPDSTESEDPQPSEDRMISRLTGNKNRHSLPAQSGTKSESLHRLRLHLHPSESLYLQRRRSI